MRSSFWAVVAAGQALNIATVAPLSTTHADLTSIVAAAEEAPAVLKQLRRMLPQLWAAMLERAADDAAAFLPVARARLQGVRDLAAQRMAEQRVLSTLEGMGGLDERRTCAGCGQRALGLHLCSRCKQAACEWAWVPACKKGAPGKAGLTKLHGCPLLGLRLRPCTTEPPAPTATAPADCSRECQVLQGAWVGDAGKGACCLPCV